MDAGTKSKTAVLICFICFFQVQSISFHDESYQALQNFDSFSRDPEKRVVKRNADWSKRLSSLRSAEVPAHVAEGSEVIEVKSKGSPRIVRRMRVRQGGEQGSEMFTEIDPGPPSKEVGKGNRIVRVKKFKRKRVRKPTTTTVVPETSTQPKPTVKPTGNSKLMSTSPYSHITVINKEIKSQKKKKKKKQKYYMVVDSPDEDSKNGAKHAMELPHIPQHIKPQPMGRSFDTPPSFSNFDDYFSRIQASMTNSRPKDFYPGAEPFQHQYTMPVMSENYKHSDLMMTRIPQFSSMSLNKMPELGYIPNSMLIKRRHTSSVPIRSRFDSEDIRQPQTNPYANLKESSTEIKEILNISRNVTTESPSNKTEATVERAEDSLTTLPTVFKNESALLSSQKETNETEARNPNTEPKIPSRNPQTTTVPIGGTAKSQQDRFPSLYPSLLYGRQNAFSDPFFDTPGIPSPMHGTRLGGQLIRPWGHQFSPFHASDGPQGDGYLFGGGGGGGMQSDEIFPGFRPSPQLTSLRRSILDTYGEELTTAEPVTPFSLPKFEMPPIDFNDKGCQTVYKEVKTLPGENPRARNSNGKSFVIARECYFPDGVPTTEGQQKDVTVAPDILKMTESILMEDSKE